MMLAALTAATLLGTTTMSAAQPAPMQLLAPPPGGTPAASTLLEAMLAIERAQAAHPAAAQQAAFTYNAAVRLYNAHDYDRARQNALLAIGQSTISPIRATGVPRVRGAPAFPGPRYDIIPDELPATAANAQNYVALAHHAMANCTDAAAATADYSGARSALDAKHYRAAMAASRNVVDDCVTR